MATTRMNPSANNLLNSTCLTPMADFQMWAEGKELHKAIYWWDSHKEGILTIQRFEEFKEQYMNQWPKELEMIYGDNN